MKTLIIIASSTGGPKALQYVIPKIPKTIHASIIIIQHMPSGFTESLAERLNELSEITVREVVDGQRMEQGNVYIAKGGYQLKIVQNRKKDFELKLVDEKGKNGLRPCADVLLQSITELELDKIVCVVMTGMGNDGLEGIRQLKQCKNTYVITQDRETSTVYGMPKAIVEAGLSDETRPLNEIADVIIQMMEVH